MDKRAEIGNKLAGLFSQIEDVLKEVRHTNNVIEVTEAYKKMREMGLWVTLALSTSQPVLDRPVQREKTKFADKRK